MVHVAVGAVATDLEEHLSHGGSGDSAPSAAGRAPRCAWRGARERATGGGRRRRRRREEWRGETEGNGSRDGPVSEAGRAPMEAPIEGPFVCGGGQRKPAKMVSWTEVMGAGSLGTPGRFQGAPPSLPPCLTTLTVNTLERKALQVLGNGAVEPRAVLVMGAPSLPCEWDASSSEPTLALFSELRQTILLFCLLISVWGRGVLK